MLQADRRRSAAALRSVIIIPARLHSTRLPRKLLLSETGKPLIQHTHEAAAAANKPDGIWLPPTAKRSPRSWTAMAVTR